MPPVGVEPTYSGFSVQRLNQLSYSGVGSAKLGQTRRNGNGRSAEKLRIWNKRLYRSIAHSAGHLTRPVRIFAGKTSHFPYLLKKSRIQPQFPTPASDFQRQLVERTSVRDLRPTLIDPMDPWTQNVGIVFRLPCSEESFESIDGPSPTTRHWTLRPP